MVTKRAIFCGKRKRPRVLRSWFGPVRMDFRFSKRRGFRLVAWAMMIVGRRGRFAPTEVPCEMPKKEAAAAVAPGTVRRPLPVPRWLEKTPTLAGYLLDLDYEDGGGPREQSYFTVRPTRSGWDVTLKDPDTCRQLRVSVTDMGTMFAALESLLISGVCPWEDDKWARERQPKKKK